MTTDYDDARALLSEMTDITESTIDRTFHRHADLVALYRDCPTAFWLAPDGDGVFAPPTPGPVIRPRPAPMLNHAPVAPPIVEGLAAGIGRALLVAGPIFAATGLMLNRTELDDHWWDPFGRTLTSLVAFPFTVSVGALLALIPVLAGVLILGRGGQTIAPLRRPALWALTGGLMGVVIAALFDASGVIAIALVATSIACAAVARTGIAWSEPDFA